MNFISLTNVSFAYPMCDDLFTSLNITFNVSQHVAIIGDNGGGKTTLLRLIAGELAPDSGRVVNNARVYFMRQLNRDETQSGGESQWQQIMRAFNSDADILLLDEPTNNLDSDARGRLFNLIRRWRRGLIIVSHDRELLNQIDTLIELRNGKISTFGGNYDFYVQMRNAYRANMESEYSDAVKEIRRLKQTAIIARNTMDTHIAKQARDKANHKRSRLEGNALKGKSVETNARLNQIIDKKMQEQIARRQELSANLRDDTIVIPLPLTNRHGQELIGIKHLSFGYTDGANVFNDFSFYMRGGERVRICGRNGCGKTTLVRIILGQLCPGAGNVKLNGRAIYLDQSLSALDPDITIVDNIMAFGAPDLNTAYAIAANFGFRNKDARKIVGTLSGGELLKATLAAVIGGENQPDLLILDEPTNNLDIKSMTVLESALNQFTGAILLISHDEMFVRNISGLKTVCLN